MPPIPIATSRFNNETWAENCTYREKMGSNICMYGAPLQITPKIPLNAYEIAFQQTMSRYEQSDSKN